MLGPPFLWTEPQRGHHVSAHGVTSNRQTGFYSAQTRCHARPSDNTYHESPSCSNSEAVIYGGNTSDLPHFLRYGRQDLHITTCGSLGFLPCVRIHSTLVPNLHCIGWRKR
jgi:hypothetical protein